MVAVPCVSTAPVPPPAYRRALAKAGPALHLDALTLVTRLRLLALCRLPVQLAHRRCPPPLPAALARRSGRAPAGLPGGDLAATRAAAHAVAPVLAGLHDWLVNWPALALACGLPHDAQGQVRVPSPSQQCKRTQRVGAPPSELFFVVMVRLARHTRLVGGGMSLSIARRSWFGGGVILTPRSAMPHTTIRWRGGQPPFSRCITQPRFLGGSS
jgi:hypothetical protein